MFVCIVVVVVVVGHDLTCACFLSFHGCVQILSASLASDGSCSARGLVVDPRLCSEGARVGITLAKGQMLQMTLAFVPECTTVLVKDGAYETGGGGGAR